MGFRVRKSFKVMPGVRMTLTPKGVGTSIGGKGARINVSSRGRASATVGIPGTGISYVAPLGGSRSTNASSRRRAAATRHAPLPAQPQGPRPGLLAPKWEKELHDALTSGDLRNVADIAGRHPEARLSVMTIDAFANADFHPHERTRYLFEQLYMARYDPAADAFLNKYAPAASVTVSLTESIDAAMLLGWEALALTVAELRQRDGDIKAAIDIVEDLEPTTAAAVSLAELYAAQQCWDEIVDLTDGVDGSDDFTTYLLVQRGAALRQLGHLDASKQTLTTALARRNQPTGLKHQALMERAATHARSGKRALARRDLERILADDATYPGLREALAALHDF